MQIKYSQFSLINTYTYLKMIIPMSRFPVDFIICQIFSDIFQRFHLRLVFFWSII